MLESKDEWKIAWEKSEKERIAINDELLQIPSGLSAEEQAAYSSIVETLKSSIKYRLSPSDK